MLAEYEALPAGATPPQFVQAAVVARSEEDIEILAKAFTGDREGYANTHRQSTAANMAKAGINFAAASDDTGM